MRRYAFILLLIIFPSFGLFAQQIPGSQYLYLGQGISYFPYGASGVADFMGMDTNFYNPAGYADTKRITAGLSMGGFSGDNFLLNARGSFPSNIGILTANVLALTSPEGMTAGNVVGLKGTFSKSISDQWLFGAAVNMGTARGGPESDLYTSFDIGTIYRKEVDGTGIGVFDHSVGFVLKNLGKNVSYEGYDSFPPLGMDFGINAEMIRQGIYRGVLGTHLMIPFNPPAGFVGFGLSNIFFDMVNVKLGLNYGVEEIGPFSFGVDLNFDLKDSDVQFSYSLLPTEFNGERQVVHNAGVSVAFGTYDRKPPETVVQSSESYFSPNHDGVNDRARFDMSIEDNTMVFGWEMNIFDHEGKPVKSFEARDVRKIRKMTAAKYFKRIFSKKQEVEIPKSIEWDGEDADGNLVGDGEFSYTLTAWDENDNKTVSERGVIIVDTIVPIVEAGTDLFLFSPNDDGVKDELAFTIESANVEEADKVVIRILDKDGNSVVEEKREGFAGKDFVWDGKNQSGALVDEGNYTFSIMAFDRAGNRTESVIDGILVKTEYERISASPSLKFFSPNGDGFLDINEIKLFSSSKEGLISWQLTVLDAENNAVREYGGEKDFPDTISFDGKDQDGGVLPDGLYSIQFRLFYESGNYPESYYKFIKVDNTAPDIEVKTNITAFSPNGDGVKDTMNLLHTIEAGDGDVFEAKIVNAAGATFKTLYYGENPPAVVVWDGMGDEGTQPVEGTYTYIITGKDDVGNTQVASFGPVKLVTGFEEVSVQPDGFVYSPNSDGVKDIINFTLNTSSREGVVEWKLDIRDARQDLVKSFNDRNMGPVVPTSITWEAISDLGSKVEDGLYTATFSMLYDTGNNPMSKPKDFKIDTQSPTIDIYAPDLNISPNDDGAKEAMVIFQNIRGEKDDVFTGEIVDFTRKVVRSFSWRGTPPVEIMWDGRDDKGNPLKEGLYTYTVHGIDSAGNEQEKTITGIVLTTFYEEVDLQATEKGISPNGDGHFDSVDFIPTISSTRNLTSWKISIFNALGQVIWAKGGAGKPPERITWNGRDDTGAIAYDGRYSHVMRLEYESGNHPESDWGVLVVDNTPPDYRFVVSPKLFSPDGDGEADTMYINIEVSDRNGVTEWDVTHYRKWDGSVDRSVPFKRFSGRGNYSRTIHWDGFSDPVQMPGGFFPPDQYTYRRSGNKWMILVDSAAGYLVELGATDSYMNSISVQEEYDTDILVIRTPDGLKIMINSIRFEFDKSDLLPQSFVILNRLIEILEKFPNYKIRVVGHTDAIGTDEYNQKLSERRAFSVYKYLVTNDVDKERLTTEGMGESQPIDTNETEVGRARNRRVEFFLTK